MPDVPVRVAPQSSTGDSQTLPADLQRDQSLRVQILLGAGAFLWAITFAMDATLAPNGDRGPYRALLEGIGFALAASGAVYVRRGPDPIRRRLQIGLWTVPVHALLLGLLNSWAVQPTTSRPLSGITMLLLFTGMLAPARPWSLLPVGLIAASMDPLGVWIAHRRGLPVPAPITTLLLFYPNYVSAILAVAPAAILYRLSREIHAARALGSYELVERIGSGGMGEVWVARHRLLARRAAIKLIRPDRAGDARAEAHGRDRFAREAHATAALTSPHTIRLFDFGTTDDGAFYYAMELLEGRDLESFVTEFGPLAPARALHLLRQICASLAEAHAMGLIHRDVKPANVFLCRMGLEYDFVKVLDFGLVRHEDRSAAPTWATAAPVAFGTPAYMAPEAILGDGDVDRRADVYAIGCVAHFLLTGRRVFTGPSPMTILMQHVNDPPRPPSAQVAYPIPREVDDLVLACLRKDPQQRPADAAAVLELIDHCAAGQGWDAAAARAWWERHLPALALVHAPAIAASRMAAPAHRVLEEVSAS